MTNYEEFSKNTVLQHRILETTVGSKLYGTATPNSDIDYCGVFIAPKELYLGFQGINEVNLSTVSKQSNGKNDKDAIDRKLYELRQFCNLALANNPNILEILYAPLDDFVFSNHLGKHLINKRYLFPHKGLIKKFGGYAQSQKKKMIVKRDNMLDIERGIELLKSLDDPNHNYVVQHKKAILNSNDRIHDTGQHLMIGDISIQKNETIKKALKKLEDRKDRFSSRFDDYVSKFGYDTKFASHLIRLLIEGYEFLRDGELTFPLKEKDLILDIKSGKYTIEEILEMADDYENRMNQALLNSPLPQQGENTEQVERVMINMIEEHWWEIRNER